MKRGDLIFILTLLIALPLFAGQSKTIKKNFIVEPGKTIEFENFSGVDIRLTAWDKNEIGINLKAYVESSDNDYEKEFIKSLNVTNDVLGSRQIITLEKTGEQPGTSILGLFKVKLFSHFRSDIKGEIFLPRNVSTSLAFNYSDLMIRGLKKIQEISGKSSDLKIYNCGIQNLIEDDYGKIEMEKCSGNLEIKSRSSTIEITDHDGSLEIKSDYSNISVENATGKVSIRDRSGSVEIKNAPVQYLDIDYTDLKVTDSNIGLDKTLKIEGKSSNYSFTDVNVNFDIRSDYTDVDFSAVNGNISFDGKSCTVKGFDVTGNIDIRSTYTGVDFSRVSSKSILIDNTSNSINLDLVTEPENIDIQNKYGNVKIEMPRGYDGEIDLRTQYGQINNDFETDTRTDKNVVTAYTKGKSPKKKIRIKNYSGDISLKH